MIFISVHSRLPSRINAMHRTPFHSRRLYNNKTTKIHMVGGKDFDDLKQFRLVQLPSVDLELKTLASVYVKRNIVFGSAIHTEDGDLVKDCLPLLRRALTEASSEGGESVWQTIIAFIFLSIKNTNEILAIESIKQLTF